MLRRFFSTLALSSLLIVATGITSLAATNTPPTFVVSDGKVSTDFGQEDLANSISIQPDGKIVLAGYSGGCFALSRYNTDGTLDTSFDGDGKSTLCIESSAYAFSVAIQADGKIVVGGQSQNKFTLARFSPDGSLDPDFNGNGVVVTDLVNSFNSSALSVLVQSDGKIIALGLNNSYAFFLVRYNSNGTLDTSFGSDGVTNVYGNGSNFFSANDIHNIVLQPDGKIVYGANFNQTWDFGIARYNSDGSIDLSFGSEGMVTTDFNSSQDIPGRVAVQADGKILLAGSSNGDFALARYTIDGNLDPSFSGDGKVSTNVGNWNNFNYSVSVQADQKIILASSGIYDSYDFVLVRYNSDGSLDTSFDGDGIVRTDIRNNGDACNGLAVQSDGKIVAAGFSQDVHSITDFTLVRYNSDGSLDSSFSQPENTLDNSTTQEQTAVVLGGHVQVLDVELAAIGNYNGASLTLKRHDGANPQDFFSAKSGGTLTTLSQGSYFSVDGVTIGRVDTNNGGILVLKFMANATQSLVNKAMQQIAYSNNSDVPPSTVQIDWIFDDGNTGAQGDGGAMSVTGSTAVSINAVNDGPQASYYLPVQFAAVSRAFSYTIPESAFADPEGEVLSYSIAMADGTGVPPWLGFNASTRTLSGTPGTGDTGSFSIRINARDVAGATASSTFEITVAQPLPEPTFVMVPTSDVDGNYTVSWGASAGAASYILQEAKDAAFTTGVSTITVGGYTNFEISGRISGVTYYYRVKSHAPGIPDSDWQTAANGCAVTFPCDVPVSITVPTADADGSYMVTWAQSATVGATYVLQEATNSTFTTALRTAYSGTAMSSTITGRSLNGTYFYRVKAMRDGYTDSAYRTAANGCAVPGTSAVAPVSITVPAADADGAFVVSWGASATTGASYYLQESTNSTFTAGLRTVSTGTALTTAITGRSQGITYYYRVRAARTGYLNSTYRAAANGCAVPGTSAVAPVSITVPAADADGAFVVSWGARATAGVTYQLQEATNSTFTAGLRIVYTGTALTSAIAGRSQGVTYFYRVKAVKPGYLDSTYRTSANGCAVPGSSTGAPVSITVPAADADGAFIVSWGASATAGASYFLQESTNSTFTAGLRTVYTGTALASAIAGRSQGVTYFYRVKAVKPGYLGSTYRTSANGCAVPGSSTGAPVSITVPAADADGAYAVSWGTSATAGVTYQLQEATNTTFTAGLRTVYTGTALTTAIAGRSQGIMYYYRVRAAKTGYLNSSYRVAANGCAVPGTSAVAPVSITVPAADADGAFVVSWGASATTGASYYLQESTNSTFTAGLRTVYTGTARTSTIAGRSQGVTYFYRVKAVKPGYLDSTYRTSANGCAVPGTYTAGIPGSLTVPDADADGAYTVTWGASATVPVIYTLQEATNSSFTAGVRTAYTGTALSAAITGRSQNVTYYYRVLAVKPGYKNSTYQAAVNGCAVPGINAVYESEYNDSSTFANHASFSAQVKGSLSSIGDQDWYYFDNTAVGTINVNFDVSTISGLGIWNVYWYDPDMAVMSGRNITAPESFSYSIPANKIGRYYVRVMQSTQIFNNGSIYTITATTGPWATQ